jgi:hypothetical protein
MAGYWVNIGGSLNQSLRLCDRGLDALDEVPGLRFRHDGVDSRSASGVLDTFQIHYGKKNDWHSGVQAGHHSRDLDAIDVGHRQVKQNQIRPYFLKFSDGGPSVFGFPTDGPLTRTHNSREYTPGNVGIVDNQNL